MSTWIQIKRKSAGLSQDDVAHSLGISRPTYNKLETGKSKPTEEQKASLSSMFNVSIDSLEDDGDTDQVGNLGTIMPRLIPKENLDKFKQVFLYVVSKVGNRPNIGQTALYKLLYFIDFDYYEKYQEYLIGAKFIKNTHGPTPVSFARVCRDLTHKGRLVEVRSKYFNYDQTKYMITKDPDVSLLSARELKHIDDEIFRLSSKSARELSDLSHKDTPWKVAKDRAELNYRHVFYRPDETSVSDN